MPTTRYARSGDIHIAYQVTGDGPVDLLYVPTWYSHVELLWEEPSVARFFERLASFARVILFDRRGSGLSDPIFAPSALEEQMDDIVAVLDAAGSDCAAVFAQLEGGAMAALFAATFPERASSLILYSTFARATRAEGYEWAQDPSEREQRVERDLFANWGEGQVVSAFAPTLAADPAFHDWAGKFERYSASPGAARTISAGVGETDVRAVLPTIRVPTLVMHRPESDLLDVRHSRYLAEHIPGARYVELPGHDLLPISGDVDALVGEAEEFILGERRATGRDRVLATVMFTDIVGSTERAAALGDGSWRNALEHHYAVVRRHLRVHRGREVKTLGDGFLATFDGPARAIRCALGISAEMDSLGMPVRVGLHTGECEVIGADVGGLAVHIAARVAAIAGSGEVLVSSTVKDLVVGSGIGFDSRGERELKGVPDTWRLFAARPERERAHLSVVPSAAAS